MSAPDVLYAQAVSLYRSGSVEPAATLCRNILSRAPNHPEGLNLLAAIESARGNPGESVKLTEKLLKKVPGYAGGYANLSLYLQQVGRFDPALKAANRAAGIDPNFAEAYAQQALSHRALKNYGLAVAAHQKELELAPTPLAYLRYGDTLYHFGDFPAAAAHYDAALALAPDFTEALHNRALALHRAGNLADAWRDASQARARIPGVAQVHLTCGAILQDREHFDEAMASYRDALACDPNLFDAVNNLAAILRLYGKFAESLPYSAQAVALNPQSPEARTGHGAALYHSGKAEEGLVHLEEAIRLNPGFAEAYAERAAILQREGQYEKARADFKDALRLNSTSPDILTNAGWLDQQMGYYGDAIRKHGIALVLKPDHAPAQFNKAILRLLQGNFAEGLPLYESRWRKADQASVYRFEQPLWKGEDIAGKTILLHAEQGLGDSIQFARYAPLVAERGAKVILAVQPSLVKLIQTMPGAQHVIPMDRELPSFDYHCPLLSLPLAFNTELHTIPYHVPYLSAEPALPPASKRRIGLVWSGSAGHVNDRNRTIPLERFAPVLARDFEFHSLQKDLRETDRAALEKHGIITHELGDMDHTAGLVQSMDTVISVDTSVAHLAGALAKKTCLLLPYVPDFRWLLDRDDSPWYPSARLFRQSAIGDWQSALDKVVSALDETETR